MNFQLELEKVLAALQKDSPLSNRPKLLLHACCAPCSSYVIEYLASFFNITILYYNPNIYPAEEYFRRLNELKTFLPMFDIAVKNSVQLIEEPYNPKDFFDAINIKENPELADEAEKGERCNRCYKFRIKKAFEFAQKNNFDYFCTTLSISPFKDSYKINKIGEELFNSSNNKTKWLYSDFKKKNGFLRSLELSNQFNLYRQQYCGCIYSAKNANKIHEQQS